MAISQQGELAKALKQAVDYLEVQGRGETAASILPIVFENLERGGILGRVRNYLKGNPQSTPYDYVGRVADYYEELNSYVFQIQEEKSASVWEPLFEEMQWWAFNYLLRKNFPNNQETFKLAKGCAANAGGELVQAYFPYDIDFGAWACTIVQNQCKKAIAGLTRASRLPDHKLVSLTELPNYHARTADLGGGHLTEWRLTLMQLIKQLTVEEQETILLYYFEGLTFTEIGRRLGISTSTAYRRYYSAINFLRKNLVNNHSKRMEKHDSYPTNLQNCGGISPS